MQKVELTMTNEEGLHSRPAMEFYKAAANFKSKVEIEKDGMSFDAKSMLMILSACICQGDLFVLSAEGEDEKEAVDTLSQLAMQLK